MEQNHTYEQLEKKSIKGEYMDMIEFTHWVDTILGAGGSISLRAHKGEFVCEAHNPNQGSNGYWVARSPSWSESVRYAVKACFQSIVVREVA